MKRFLVFLLLPVLGFAQGVLIQPKTTLSTVNGLMRPVAPTVTVCPANSPGIPCAPASTSIFKDAALSSPLSNPIVCPVAGVCDANGNYQFAVAPGTYTVTETASGFAGYSYQFTAQCPANGNCIWTGNTSFNSSVNINGAANLNGGGSFAGFFNGNLTMSGPVNLTNTLSSSGTNTFANLNLLRFASQFPTSAPNQVQNAVNNCPAAPTQCWVIADTGTTDTTAIDLLSIPVNVGVMDLRAKPSLGDGNTSHVQFGGMNTVHGFEVEATGGSNSSGEGPAFVTWNNNNLSTCGAATCTTDMTASVVWSFGPLSGRLYSFLIHGGWFDGTNWHPDPDFMTNSGKTATAQPGKSRLRIGATGAFIFNPAVTSVTSQLDPEIAETNGWLNIVNDQVGSSGQALQAFGRNYNWSVMPQKWGGTFANSATDPPSALATLNGGGNGVWIDSNCGSAGNNVCLQFRDSNGASGITQKIYNASAAGLMDFNNSSGVMQVRLDASTGNGTVTAGTYTNSGVTQIYRVTSDFTTANNTSLQAITGLVLTLPASLAQNVPISCHLLYSQATAAVADNFGIQAASFAPTNIMAKMQAYTSTTVFTAGNLPTLNTTTATAIGGTFTPSAITTVWQADIDAMIENPSNAGTNTINIMVGTSNGADAITIKRGSFCRAF